MLNRIPVAVFDVIVRSVDMDMRDVVAVALVNKSCRKSVYGCCYWSKLATGCEVCLRLALRFEELHCGAPVRRRWQHETRIVCPRVCSRGRAVSDDALAFQSLLNTGRLQRVRVLDLRGCHKIRDPGLVDAILAQNRHSLHTVYYLDCQMPTGAVKRDDGPTLALLRSLSKWMSKLTTFDIEVIDHKHSFESELNQKLLPAVLDGRKLRRLRIANSVRGQNRPHFNSVLESICDQTDLVDLELHLDNVCGESMQFLTARNLLHNIGIACYKLQRLALKCRGDDVARLLTDFSGADLRHRVVPTMVRRLELGFFEGSSVPWDLFEDLASANGGRLRELYLGVTFVRHTKESALRQRLSRSQPLGGGGACAQGDRDLLNETWSSHHDHEDDHLAADCSRRIFWSKLRQFREAHSHVQVNFQVQRNE